MLDLVHRFNMARCEGDLPSLELLLADNLRHVDHRPIGYPEAPRNDVLDGVVANRDITYRGLARTYHVLSERGVVRTAGMWTEVHGDWREFEIGVYLTVVSDARPVRTECFEVDRLDDAIRRFRSLTSPQR